MEEKDFDALTDMFASDGWALYQKQLKEFKDTLIEAAPEGAVTNDQWQFARGQIRQLRAELGYENFVKVSWDQQNEPATIEASVNVDAI